MSSEEELLKWVKVLEEPIDEIDRNAIAPFVEFPVEMRPVLWLHLTGADEQMSRHKGFYQTLLSHAPLNADKDKEMTDQIDADVPRTFSEADSKQDWIDDRKAALRRVLVGLIIALPQWHSHSACCIGGIFSPLPRCWLLPRPELHRCQAARVA
jgi:hypothetical protein